MENYCNVLVYWTKEHVWSILSQKSIKKGSATIGSHVQALFLGKVCPATVIAIAGKLLPIFEIFRSRNFTNFIF